MEYVFDPYTWREKRKILTQNELIVPGLEMFGLEGGNRQLGTLPPHIHRSTEFLYLANGAQTYFIGEKEYLLTGNNVLVVNKDVVHSTGGQAYGRYENIWFRIDLPVFAQNLPLPPAERINFCDRITNLSSPILSLRENRFPQMQSAFYSLASGEPAAQLRGYAQFIDFVAYLLKCTDPAASYSPDIQQAVQYIADHVENTITLEELAHLCHLSLSAFKQKFHRETGVSPREYINLQKIKQAKTLLTAGKSVTETAFALDFSSSSYFSVVFKQMENVAPAIWQAEQNKKREV